MTWKKWDMTRTTTRCSKCLATGHSVITSKKAINWAWEYLVEVLKLNPEHLRATVFREGSPRGGLRRVDESCFFLGNFLLQINFYYPGLITHFLEIWDMGPSGPCSEIHIDLRPAEER